jgi:hypothetical protein
MLAADGLRLANFRSITATTLVFTSSSAECDPHHIYRKLFHFLAPLLVKWPLLGDTAFALQMTFTAPNNDSKTQRLAESAIFR